MASVMKCDRCGKIYEIEKCNIRIIVRYATTGSTVCYYDLCPDCVDRFHEFLGNKQTSEKENNQTADRRVGDVVC